MTQVYSVQNLVSNQTFVDFLFIVTPIVGVCNCSLFCCTLLYVHSSIVIILMGKRELVTLLNLSSWCLVMVERLFLEVPRGCLRFVIVVFPDHTHYFYISTKGVWTAIESQIFCKHMAHMSTRVHINIKHCMSLVVL